MQEPRRWTKPSQYLNLILAGPQLLFCFPQRGIQNRFIGRPFRLGDLTVLGEGRRRVLKGVRAWLPRDACGTGVRGDNEGLGVD